MDSEHIDCIFGALDITELLLLVSHQLDIGIELNLTDNHIFLTNKTHTTSRHNID